MMADFLERPEQPEDGDLFCCDLCWVDYGIELDDDRIISEGEHVTKPFGWPYEPWEYQHFLVSHIHLLYSKDIDKYVYICDNCLERLFLVYDEDEDEHVIIDVV